MKTLYVKPATEELQEVLAANILDASGDAEREGYGDGGTFEW